MTKVAYFVSIIFSFLSVMACSNGSNTAAKGTDTVSAGSDASLSETPAGQPMNDSIAGNEEHPNDSSRKLDGPAPDSADTAFIQQAASGGGLEVQLGCKSFWRDDDQR